MPMPDACVIRVDPMQGLHTDERAVLCEDT